MDKKTQQGDATEEKASGLSIKLLVVIMVAVAVVILTIMGAGILIIQNKMAAVMEETAAARPGEAQKPVVQRTFRPVYTLKTFIVPLASPENHRFLRVTLALELGDDKGRLALQTHLAQIRETIHGILPNRTVAQVVTTEGKAILRDEILKRVRTVLPEASVTDLYYMELVVE
ncbi:MAG: flagellar basal body-associated FliL family protein [Desulfobacterales bacterium]|nr:flagellar basal body-associated FliL family protein [Desulfobacterales bacterium]